MGRLRSAGVVLVVGGVLGHAASASALVPSTVRVNLTSSGAQLDFFSGSPSISADGRWVSFDSDDPNAVPGDGNNARDVFLRDRSTGETRRISVRPDGTEANGNSFGASMSANGRYITFSSQATNLATGPTNSFLDSYLYDRVANTLTLLSRSTAGGEGAGASRDPKVSADGTHVVFESTANDLVAGDTGRSDVFDYDIASGALTRVSATPGGGTADGDSRTGDVSPGGRFATFTSEADDLVAGDLNGLSDVFVRDMQTGRTERVSVTSAGGEANNASQNSAIDDDGCLVAFNSSASNLVAGDDRVLRVKAFVHDRCTGNTELVSRSNTGAQGAVADTRPSISDDGCAIGFISPDVGASGGVFAAVLRDRCQGRTERLDVSSSGEGGNNFAGTPKWNGRARFVAFESAANNLVAGDTNGTYDVFVRDRATAQPPVADLVVTVDGLRVTADGSRSYDPDGRIVSAHIQFGDGSDDVNGLNAVHEYARDGSYTITAFVTDSDGLTSIASRPVTVSGGAVTPAPIPTQPPDGGGQPPAGGTLAKPLTISGGVLSRSRFSPVPVGGKISGKRGTHLLLAASDRATLELRFDRQVRGRVVKGTCRAGAKRGRGCTLSRTLGTATFALRAGDNDVPITGRIGRRALPAGVYRLRLVARARDGRISKPLVRAFTIVKEKK